MKKFKINHFRKLKENGEKIVMITCFDAPGAAMAAGAGVEILLVGDSLAMTVLGYENTLPLTMDEMLHHVKAVRRGAPTAFIAADMPFMSYQVSDAEALYNAGRILKEGAADAVKLEGGAELAPLVGKMVNAGIPVISHIGLLPQKILTSGGYFIPGRTPEAAQKLRDDAMALQEAGSFMAVLECVPAKLAGKISSELVIPAIGIGSGVDCDGQVQVLMDTLGMFDEFLPKHAKRYAEAGNLIREGLKKYVEEVKQGRFPGVENSFE